VAYRAKCIHSAEHPVVPVPNNIVTNVLARCLLIVSGTSVIAAQLLRFGTGASVEQKIALVYTIKYGSAVCFIGAMSRNDIVVSLPVERRNRA